MRTASCLAALLVCGLVGSAQAQCCYIPPPHAPDFHNQPGYYAYNCQGYLYGPYYNVRPPFQPFQGAILAPQAAAAIGYKAAGFSQGPGMGGPPGLWMHPAVRSPRDFFMIETDPARSDYRFGVGRGAEDR